MAHVVCMMTVDDDRATFNWSEGPASFPPYELSGQVFHDFKDIAREVREKLSDLVKDRLSGPENVPKASFKLAEAGHELYLQLFDPGAGQARIAADVRNWLESLRNTRTVATLEIVVDSPWALPWNTIYDEEPDREAFLSNQEDPSRWKRFWGIRYNLCGGRKVSPLRRLPLMNDPTVLLVVDPRIRDGLPEEQQKQLADFSSLHNLKMVHSQDELADQVKAARPDVLYWLSHATPEALYLGDDEITPRKLRRLLRRDAGGDEYELGGIAFLNACQTAEAGEAGSFFDALHSVGFSGMVGTEHQTIDTFANPLGLTFLESFLIKGMPLGETMRELRAQVPLGLLYGTYCPPDLRVVRDAPTSIDDSVYVVQTPFEMGLALGVKNVVTPSQSPLPDEPYRSLAYYGYHDRALFAGREEDVERFATLLDDEQVKIVVLHGESGVGKSSFLRAGVIPYLEEECLGYRFVREKLDRSGDSKDSALFIRATNDLAGAMAQSISQFCAHPFNYSTPTGNDIDVDLPAVLQAAVGKSVDAVQLRERLLNDPSLLGRLLAAVGDVLPFSPVLVIDQCEEVFTLAQTPEDEENRQLALAMLRQTLVAPTSFKIILSLRTEYYGRLIDRLRRGGTEIRGIREYLLTDFDEQQLLDAILRPTLSDPGRYSAEAPFDKYEFCYTQGVAEEIARRVVRFSQQRRDSVLPLMQVVCNQVYQRVRLRERDERYVVLEDLEHLGGIEGGMRKHVESQIEELFREHPSDKRHLQQLFTQLYLQQPDGSLTTALLPEDDVQGRWTGQMPFDSLLEQTQQLRLLRVNTLRIGGGEERRYVSLGHDSLAKLSATWDEELSRGARMRKMVIAIGSVSAVAVVMFALAGFALLSRSAAITAKQEADSARDAAVDTVNKYFSKVSTNRLLNEPGQQQLREELMELARSDLQRFVETQSGAQHDPTVQARLAQTHYNLARLQIEVHSNFADAINHHLIPAREIQEQLVKDHAAPDYLSDLSDTWMEIGNAATGLADWELVNLAYSTAFALRRQLSEKPAAPSQPVEAGPLKPNRQLKLADAMMSLGLYKMYQIEAAEAEVEAAEGQPESKDAKTSLREAREQIDEAVDQMHKAQDLRAEQREHADNDEDRADILQKLALGHYNLGLFHVTIDRTNTLLNTNSPEDQRTLARVHFEDAINHCRRLLVIRSNDILAQLHLGYSYRNLGDVAPSIDQTIVHYQQAEQELRTLAEKNPLLDELQKEYADMHWLLGDELAARAKSQQDATKRTGDVQAAIVAYRAAQKGYEKLLKKKSTCVREEDADLDVLDGLVADLKKGDTAPTPP